MRHRVTAGTTRVGAARNVQVASGSSCSLLPRFDRSAAESDLVSRRLPEDRLADPVAVGLQLRRGDSAVRGALHEAVKIVEKDRHHCMTRMLRLLHDVNRPVLGKTPDAFGRVRLELRWRSEQPL